jgi:hypothetical protein
MRQALFNNIITALLFIYILYILYDVCTSDTPALPATLQLNYYCSCEAGISQIDFAALQLVRW